MIYLDHAATSFPKPKSVLEKAMSVMTEYGANPGRSGHKLAMRANREIFDTREKLATLFHIENPLDIALTFNCTVALNMAIHGTVGAGDHVVTTSMEHNSVLRPLNTLRAKGVEISIVKAGADGIVDPKAMEAEIRPNTKLLVSTHVSNLTGSIQPIAELGRIAKARNITFLVDAAQSAGVYDIDVVAMGIDLLAFPGHKSLLGLQGTGGLYVNEELDLETIIEGGTGSFSNSVDQPILMPDKLESGTLNAPGLIALGAGVDFILSEGIEKIRRHEEDLAFRFMEGLAEIPKVEVYGAKVRGKHAPVVMMNIHDVDSSELAGCLNDDWDIAVRPGLHCAPLAHETMGTFRQGAVRFSFGYTNTDADVDRALEAIRAIANR